MKSLDMLLGKSLLDKSLWPAHWAALLSVFVLSFLFNLIWEELHSLLYISYQGGPITQTILFHATLADAGFITLLAIFFFNSRVLRERLWIIIPIGLALAVTIELWALGTHRWVYTSTMPLVPFIDVGLTPVLQLAVTGYVTLWMISKNQIKTESLLKPAGR